MNNHQFYTPPTNLNSKGLLLAIAASLPVAVIIAFLYAILSMINPIVYLGILLTIATGWFLGFWSRVIARITHNTNKKSQLILAVTTGVTMVYSNWVAYVLYAMDGGVPNLIDYFQALQWIIVDPGSLIDTIMAINEIGMWSIGRGSSDSGNVTGGFLWLVWALESGILLVAPILSVMLAKVFPYSSKLNKWYPKMTINEQFKSITNPSGFLASFQEKPLETLDALGFGSGTRHSRMHVYYLEGEQSHYLEVESVYIDAENKVDTDSIIYLYKIGTSVAKQLLDKYDYSRERMEVV